MRTLLITGFVTSLLVSQEEKKQDKPFQMPQPTKQHEWLKQLVGEWDADVEIYGQDGKATGEKLKGTESGRMVGEFWAFMENKGTFQGKPFQGFFSIGYDTDQKKFVGAWFDNMSHHLWQYTGDVDSAGRVLTLSTEGPCPMEGNKITKFRETIEIKSPEHKVFTSMREKDGKWVKNMTINYRKRASE